MANESPTIPPPITAMSYVIVVQRSDSRPRLSSHAKHGNTTEDDPTSPPLIIENASIRKRNERKKARTKVRASEAKSTTFSLLHRQRHHIPVRRTTRVRSRHRN